MRKNFYKYLSIVLAIALVVSLAFVFVPNSKDVQASSNNPKLKEVPRKNTIW